MNSQEVARRVKKFYGREAIVIYPPVELPNVPRRGSYFRAQREKMTGEYYYLVVSRLLSYKRIDLAIKAANELKVPLKIVGTGREETRLKRMAGSTVEFLGFLSDEKISELYLGCQALIFPTDEDFGIVPVEAMSFGKPVIAFAKGGALETVIAGKTGEFFKEPTMDSLVEVWRSFDPSNYKAEDCVAQAKKFNKERFKEEILKFVRSKTG